MPYVSLCHSLDLYQLPQLSGTARGNYKTAHAQNTRDTSNHALQHTEKLTGTHYNTTAYTTISIHFAEARCVVL